MAFIQHYCRTNHPHLVLELLTQFKLCIARRRHWITVSTKWYKGGKVEVYDSVFIKLDAETRTTIIKMFQLKKTKDIIMMPMQKQHGSTDCGIFAIAVITSLVHEEDPSRFKYKYKQMELKQHLVVELHYKGRTRVLSKTITY